MTQLTPESLKCTINVGELSREVTETMLYNHFTSHLPGTTEPLSVLSVSIVKDYRTSASLGYGFINFSTIEDTYKAMEAFNFTEIMGRPCRMRWVVNKTPSETSQVGVVTVKNINISVSERDFWSYMMLVFPTCKLLFTKIKVDYFDTTRAKGIVQIYPLDEASRIVSALKDGECLAHGMNLGSEKLSFSVTPFLMGEELIEYQNKKPFDNVYVKNIPKNWTNSDLSAAFAHIGAVNSVVVELSSDNTANSLNKGFGFVSFVDAHHAKEAVETMNNHDLGNGVFLEVSRAQMAAERKAILKRQYKPPNTKPLSPGIDTCNLLVKNLDDDVNDDKLHAMFKVFGNIKSVKVMMEDNVIPRGFGFVSYFQAEDATKALLSMNGAYVSTRPLIICYAQKRIDRTLQSLSIISPSTPVSMIPRPWRRNAQVKDTSNTTGTTIIDS